jgi:hypothetical protein
MYRMGDLGSEFFLFWSKILLYVPPLGPPILEPGLHLRVRHLQIFGHLRAFRARQVFLRRDGSHQSTGR